jgi:hypothetical protein
MRAMFSLNLSLAFTSLSAPATLLLIASSKDFLNPFKTVKAIPFACPTATPSKIFPLPKFASPE